MINPWNFGYVGDILGFSEEKPLDGDGRSGVPDGVFGAHKSCVWSLGTPFAVAEPHRWFAGRIRFVSDCGPPKNGENLNRPKTVQHC